MPLNIGILAHVDAGKTTITEQLLYFTGAIRLTGRVDDGTSKTDFLEVERRRGISVRTSSVSVEYGGRCINIIDTPGHVDFASEVERAVSVLDAAVLVVSSVESVQPQTEVLFEALKKTGTPCVVFVNKADRAGSDCHSVLTDIGKKFSLSTILCSKIDGEQSRECSVSARNFDDADFFNEVFEVCAENDETLAEKYISGIPVSKEELKASVSSQMRDHAVVPVLCGSGLYGIGIRELLDFICTYFHPEKNRSDDKLSAVIYKVTHDKAMGRIAHVRLFGGEIKSRDSVVLMPSGNESKITQIRRYQGEKFVDLGCVGKGEIAALCGLPFACASDYIGEALERHGFDLATPLMKVRVIPANEDDIYALVPIISELSAEDPKLYMEFYKDERELVISVVGSVQLEILCGEVKRRSGIDISFGPPAIIYKETPCRKGFGRDAYTMPKPCWAIVELEIEPMPRGTGLVYDSIVENNRIFYRYQNHIQTSVAESLKQGLYNWEVTDLSVKLVGGEHHTVHTHPLDFFVATPCAVMDALKNVGTKLLEPYEIMRLSADEVILGKVIGDMVSMRATHDTPIIKNGTFTLESSVPAAESLDYSKRFAALSSGRGMMSKRFDNYYPCPEGFFVSVKRRGINPLDRAKWILYSRNAMRSAD